MATVVLSAASEERPALRDLSGVLAGELRTAGETDIRTFELATTPLAYCQGEFDCWVKTPGTCRAHDAEAAILQAIHDADRVVMLDAVTLRRTQLHDEACPGSPHLPHLAVLREACVADAS